MNYVMSDIHGHLKEFNEMLKLINFKTETDHLYILGDIVDKGEEPIPLLLKIMEMVKEGSVTYIIGNHDHMFIDWYEWEYLNHSSSYHYGCWLLNNGGQYTAKQFEKLDNDKKEEIYNFFLNSYLFYPNLKINNRNFYLAHSLPGSNYYQKPITLKELGRWDLFVVKDIIWDRHYCIYEEVLKQEFPDTIFIGGHTINLDGKIHKITNNYIDIDCGCAININLGCLCLETMEEHYISCEKKTEAK